MRPKLELTNAGMSAFVGTNALTISHFLCGSSYDTNNQDIQDESPFQFNIAFQKLYIKGQQYEKDGVTVTEDYNHIKVIGYLSASDITFDETGEYTVREIALIGNQNNEDVVLAYGWNEEGITLYEDTQERQIIKLDIICENTPNIAINNSTAFVNYGDFLDHKDDVLTANNPVHGLTYQNNRLCINGSPLTIDVEGVSNQVFDNVIGVNSEIEVLPSVNDYSVGHIIRDKATGTMLKCTENNGIKSWQIVPAINPRFEMIENNLSACQWFPTRLRLANYSIGDVVKDSACKPFQYLEAVNVGITGNQQYLLDSSQNPIMSYTTGEVYQDGNVFWFCCDIRDSRLVGEIALLSAYQGDIPGYLRVNEITAGAPYITIFDTTQQTWCNPKYIRLIRASIPTLIRNITVYNSSQSNIDPTKAPYWIHTSTSNLLTTTNSPLEERLGAVAILACYCNNPSEPPDPTSVDKLVGCDFSFVSGYLQHIQEVGHEIYEQLSNGAFFYMTVGSMKDRYLKMDQGYEPYSSINEEAGLPNITGSANLDIPDSSTVRISSTSGALGSGSSTTSKKLTQTSNTFTQNKQLTFNASSSNSIYGSSTTVRPANVTVFPYIKL